MLKQKATIFFISPDHRGKGHGSAVLSQLLAHAEDIIGTSFEIAEAVIFPNNISSIRCFEKAGFVFESAHPDGDALYYTYSKSKSIVQNLENNINGSEKTEVQRTIHNLP